MPSSVEHQVEVARVIKAHGIRGEVACELRTDVEDRLAPGTSVTVGETPMVVASSRPHQGRLLVRFEGVADRTEAELLRGRTVCAEPLEEAEHDVYFAHELVGMAVVDVDGRALGRVRALVDLPAAAEYDLLEVEQADGERWLLPAVDEYVEVGLDADDVERLVVVDPPEGLLDDLPS